MGGYDGSRHQRHKLLANMRLKRNVRLTLIFLEEIE